MKRSTKKQIAASTDGWIVLCNLDGPMPNAGRWVVCGWSVGGSWDGLSNVLHSDWPTAVFGTWDEASRAINATLKSVKKNWLRSPNLPLWAHRDAYLIVPLARVRTEGAPV